MKTLKIDLKNPTKTQKLKTKTKKNNKLTICQYKLSGIKTS